MLSIFSQLIFGSPNLFGNQSDAFKTLNWRDKSLSFDLRNSELELAEGEQLIACFYPIEDIKGNPNELGVLKLTNLRLIYICCDKKRVNLSIGWRTVSLAFKQNLKDSLGRTRTSLCILIKYESTKYEFVFNKMPSAETGRGNEVDLWDCQGDWGLLMKLRKFCKEKSLPVSHLSPMYLDDPFDVVFKVWQSYKQTQLFRHCRANLSHLLSSNRTEVDVDPATNQLTHPLSVGDINKLPSEDSIEIYKNILHYESRSVRYTGVLILTNLRIIWIDDSLPLRNMSIPYIRIGSMKLKQSDRLIINTLDYVATTTHIELRSPKSGSTAMKFVFEQAQDLYTLFKARPRFGPESCEDCINFASYLRPVEEYFNSLDDSLGRNIENFGPAQVSSEQIHTVDLDTNTLTSRSNQYSKFAIDEDVDRAESELAGYKSKLNSYFSEKPIVEDKELIYSLGESIKF